MKGVSASLKQFLGLSFRLFTASKGGDNSIGSKLILQYFVLIDFQTGNGPLCPWESYLRLFSRGSSSLPDAMAQPDERLANRTQKS